MRGKLGELCSKQTKIGTYCPMFVQHKNEQNALQPSRLSSSTPSLKFTMIRKVSKDVSSDIKVN